MACPTQSKVRLRNQLAWILCADLFVEREAALHDDFRLERTYDYEDDDEWDDDAEQWTAEEEANATEVVADAKDESTAYLEFLNEEVSADDSSGSPG